MESKNEVRLTGVLAEISVEKTTKGKDIAKLVIAVDAPSWMDSADKVRIPVTVIGKTVLAVRSLKPGIGISMLGRVDGREYQGKLYTNIVGEKFKELAAPAPVANPPSEVMDDDVPF
jgi:hypothetical protein